MYSGLNLFYLKHQEEVLIGQVIL